MAETPLLLTVLLALFNASQMASVVPYEDHAGTTVQELVSTLLQKDRALQEKERTLAEKNEALMLKDQFLMEKDQALQEKDKILREKDQALQEKDRTLLEKDKALLEMTRTLLEKDKVLLEKDKALVHLAETQRRKGNSSEDRIEDKSMEMDLLKCLQERNLPAPTEPEQKSTTLTTRPTEAPTTAAPLLDCRPDFQRVGRDCLRLLKGGRSWRHARRDCQGLGADLFSPRDPWNFRLHMSVMPNDSPSSVLDFLEQERQKLGWQSLDAWLGASVSSDGLMKWLSGTELPLESGREESSLQEGMCTETKVFEGGPWQVFPIECSFSLLLPVCQQVP